MKKNIPKIFIISFFLFQLTISAFSQQWTNPINISNLTGLDLQADLCVDKNGILHCVFNHEVNYSLRKILYTKSSDFGETWSLPVDISLNNEKVCYNAHIVADTNNDLYVCYDYNIWDPANDLVYFRKYSANQWSDYFIVSEGLPGSDYNRIVVDSNNRFYCFWFSNQGGGKVKYRYLDGEIWSEIFEPYPDETYLVVGSVVSDNLNNLHFVGGRFDTNTYWGSNVVYFQYLYEQNLWSDIVNVSNSTISNTDWKDIDLNSENLPGMAFYQRSEGSPNDSTMYSHLINNNWTEPELVVNDPKDQRIIYDSNNKVHIIDKEKTGESYKLVHYQKINGMWQGYIIDIASFNISFPEIEIYNNTLLLVFDKSYISQIADIYFCKYDITTDYNNNSPAIFTKLNVFPNPFSDEITVDFGINDQGTIDLSVYDFEGRLIKTLFKDYKIPGTYRIIWNGKDLDGKEVKTGLYIVRLQSGRNTVTKPVEKLK